MIWAIRILLLSAAVAAGQNTGSLYVNQPTAANLNATVVQATGTNLHMVSDSGSVTAATLSAETTKVIGTVRMLGNGGATLDSTVGAGTAPTNMIAVGGVYNSTAPTPSSGQSLAIQLDSGGFLKTVNGVSAGPVSGSITTAGGSNVSVTTKDASCVGVMISGTWTGTLSFQESLDGSTWNTATAFAEFSINGQWQATTPNNGNYWVSLPGFQAFRVMGPTSTGSAGIVLNLNPSPCNTLTLSVPYMMDGNGSGTVAATGTQSTTVDGIQGHNAAELYVKWASITGSPAGCNIQAQGTPDGSTFTNTGPAIPVTPGTNAVLLVPGPFAIGTKFVYACNSYPSGGTITISTVYKQEVGTVAYDLQYPEVTAAWTSSTAGNTALLQLVQGKSMAHVFLNQGSTITGGAVTFEKSDSVAFTNAYSVACSNTATSSQGGGYALVASTNIEWDCPVDGAVAFRVRLSTAITGSATVNVGITVNTLPSTSNVVATVQTLPSNASVNVAQIGSTNVNTGNGTSGAGNLRVNVASDNSAIANWGHGATGSAVPSGATYFAGNGSGNLTGVQVCDSSAFLNMTSATTTQIVALSSSKKIHVCSWRMWSEGTTTGTWKYGTGSNCGTGTTALSMDIPLIADTGFATGAGLGELYGSIAVSNALCLTNSAAVNLHAEVSYTVN